MLTYKKIVYNYVVNFILYFIFIYIYIYTLVCLFQSQRVCLHKRLHNSTPGRVVVTNQTFIQ